MVFKYIVVHHTRLLSRNVVNVINSFKIHYSYIRQVGNINKQWNKKKERKNTKLKQCKLAKEKNTSLHPMLTLRVT
jgi:cell shape-determining protein MreC